MTIHIACDLADLGVVLERVIATQLRADTDAVRQHVTQDVADAVVHEVHDIIRREDIEYLGNLRRLYLHHGPDRTGLDILGDARYAGVIEHGRRPGRKPPPFLPILRWVRIKLAPRIGLPESAHWIVAKTIQRNIGVRGTPPKLVLWRALQSHVHPAMVQSVRRHLPAPVR